jgi:hypothetical protein
MRQIQIRSQKTFKMPSKKENGPRWKEFKLFKAKRLKLIRINKKNLKRNKNKCRQIQFKSIDFLIHILLHKHLIQLKFSLHLKNRISRRLLTNCKISYSIIWLIQMRASSEMQNKTRSKAKKFSQRIITLK